MPEANPPITFTVEKGSVLLKKTSSTWDETTFEGTNDLQASFEGVDPECSISDQPWVNFVVKAVNQDDMVHQGTPFEFTVTMIGKWEGTVACPSFVRGFSQTATAFPTFHILAEDGASYEWKSPGFKEGSIVFTLRDKYGYLDWIGRIKYPW